MQCRSEHDDEEKKSRHTWNGKQKVVCPTIYESTTYPILRPSADSTNVRSRVCLQFSSGKKSRNSSDNFPSHAIHIPASNWSQSESCCLVVAGYYDGLFGNCFQASV